MQKTVFSILILFCLEVFGQTIKSSRNDIPPAKQLRAGGFNFINPLLDCNDIRSTDVATSKRIEKLVLEYIEKAKKEKKCEMVSMYFRDLNNGPWIGINEEADYSPASLLKVPILLAALFNAQQDPTFLTRMITYNEYKATHDQLMEDPVHIKVGSTYSMAQLLEYMIIHSDNEAKNLVFKNIPPSVTAEVFREMGVDMKVFLKKENFMSVKDYSSYFRVLYNSTLLNRQMSQYALRMLSRTIYSNGIGAGVPRDIVVANKFGIRAFGNSKIMQFHDCGIVYKPGFPYLLCVMTRGYDNKQLEKIIGDISKIVYDNVPNDQQLN